MATISVLESMIKIIIMIVPGFVFGKFNIINADQNQTICKFVTHVSLPCLIIDAMQIDFSYSVLVNCADILSVYLIVFIILFVIAAIIFRAFHIKSSNRYLLLFMLMFGNTGFIGIPVIHSLYGDEALFFAALIEVIADILMFTVGVTLLSSASNNNEKFNFKNLISPALVAVVIGLLLFIIGTKLPEIISNPISTIGSATTPLSMFVIGFQFTSYPVRDIFNDFKIYILSIVKLLMVPAIACIVVYLLNIETQLIKNIIIVGLSMPVASFSIILSQQYKCDTFFASKGVTLSTILSLITIPLVAIFLV